MRLPLIRFWHSFRASYWFMPSLMVIVSTALGAFVIWLDAGPASDLLDGLGWYQQSKPDGAREVLSTIAGSMITVAGVVFSITIVAISYAANQYGPRILTNFMSDRGNQVTLGTFIATFVYSLVVLRTIYSGDEEFVPQLAVVVALLLALCSIAVLIYFIHHIPESIHVNSVAARVGRQLLAVIDDHFPACFGDAPDHTRSDENRFARLTKATFGSGGDVRAIDSNGTGYLQAIDEEHLMSVARKHDLIVSIRLAPGHFVYPGVDLAHAAPASRVTDEIADSLRQSWAAGRSRTPDQDLLFLVDELVEIAARALSTGVNDPYTAMTCSDWLCAASAEILRRQPPSPYRLDNDGELRVIAPTLSLEDFLERGFGRLRPYAARDINAATHVLCCLAGLADHCPTEEAVTLLSAEADALFDLAKPNQGGPSLDRLKQEITSARGCFAERRSRLTGPGIEATA